jgi:hypothetical protein
VLRVQRRRGFHHDSNDLRRRNGLERGRLPSALRKHALDTGKTFFFVIGFNHLSKKRGNRARQKHEMAASWRAVQF